MKEYSAFNKVCSALCLLQIKNRNWITRTQKLADFEFSTRKRNQLCGRRFANGFRMFLKNKYTVLAELRTCISRTAAAVLSEKRDREYR
jgi:predicted secreted protein